MIKYKANNITDVELEDFRSRIDDMIWKIIHKSTCYYSKQDLYQEIWERIASATYRWDEEKTNNVTTWIWRLALSVLGQKKYELSKNITINVSSLVESEDEKFSLDNVLADTSDTNRIAKNNERWIKFIKSLDDVESVIAEMVMKPDQSLLDKMNKRKKNNRSKLTKNEMIEIMGISDKDFVQKLNDMKVKFYSIMDKVEEYEQ